MGQVISFSKSARLCVQDNEIDGITPCSRLLGCNFLYPAVIPEPHTYAVELGEPDEFLLIASRGLWEQMDYAEAVRRIRYIPNPILAAKHLQVQCGGQVFVVYFYEHCCFRMLYKVMGSKKI